MKCFRKWSKRTAAWITGTAAVINLIGMGIRYGTILIQNQESLNDTTLYYSANNMSEMFHGLSVVALSMLWYYWKDAE